MKRTSKQFLSILLVFVMVMSLLATAAFAKTSSSAIAAPSNSTVVFTVKIGGNIINYTWADINGKGSFSASTGTYSDKDSSGNLTTASRTGVLLSDILKDFEKKTGFTPADNYVISTIAADGYLSTFTVGDVRNAANNYRVCCDPVSNFDGSTAYGNSYVRIVCGDSKTLPNKSNFRCLAGIELSTPDGKAFLSKIAGGDVKNSVFYIAVKESTTSAIKYYYYTLKDLQAYSETHDFKYNDHTVDKTVTAKGALITSLLKNITDAKITNDMIIQYAESDGYHADQATAIESSNYKDKVSWLTSEHTTSGGETAAAVNTSISFAIRETYAKPDENNVNTPAGTWLDADDNSGYLRAYRQRSDANSAVIKYLMGIVISPDGQLFTGKDGYTLKAYSTKNTNTAIASYNAVTGLVPGMQYSVKAPTVVNSTLASGTASYQIITAVSGSDKISVRFNYDEATYFTVNVDGKATNYVYTDFLVSKDNCQTPTAEAGKALMTQTKGISYGYYDTMLYRYNGIWLDKLVGATDSSKAISLIASDGTKTVIKAADLSRYFVAYANTQSKSSTNVPENKRITKTYSSPSIIIPGDGTVVTADSNSALIGEKGNKVTTTVAAAKSVVIGGTPFADTGAYSWADEAISYLYSHSVVSGTTATTFSPDKSISRGDFMVMLYRAYNLGSLAKASGNFSDVAAGSYYYDAISAAKSLGIATGSGDGSFSPTSSITREDAMTLLYRTLVKVGKTPSTANDLSSFTDKASVSSYAQDSIKALVGAGVINGSDGKLAPQGSMTRAQMAHALYKALTKLA